MLGHRHLMSEKIIAQDNPRYDQICHNSNKKSLDVHIWTSLLLPQLQTGVFFIFFKRSWESWGHGFA